MPMFRKKPVVVEAEQFNAHLLPLPFEDNDVCHWDNYLNIWYIETREGRRQVSGGDWIIKGAPGEFYPCKPDIFEATYEPWRRTPNKSTIVPPDTKMQGEIRGIFSDAKMQTFTTGMASVFSKSLCGIIRKHGRTACVEIWQILFYEQTTADVAAEALKWLGDMDHQETHKDRRAILEYMLFNGSSIIRDGALLGISFMDDPESVSAVHGAIAVEKIPELKEDMQAVLEQLEATRKKIGEE